MYDLSIFSLVETNLGNLAEFTVEGRHAVSWAYSLSSFSCSLPWVSNRRPQWLSAEEEETKASTSTQGTLKWVYTKLLLFDDEESIVYSADHRLISWITVPPFSPCRQLDVMAPRLIIWAADKSLSKFTDVEIDRNNSRYCGLWLVRTFGHFSRSREHHFFSVQILSTFRHQ